MKLLFIIHFLLAIGAVNSNKLFSQMIVPLYKLPDAYTDTQKNKGLIIPSLNLRVDTKNQLFQGDSLLFKPESDFEFCIYEIVNNKYLLISAISRNQSSSSAIYILPKHKVKLYLIGSNQKALNYDFCAKKLVEINDRYIVLKNNDGRTENLKL